MSSIAPHHQTRPEDRISLGQKVVYGSGQISNVLLAIAIANLAPFVLTVELGVNAGLVGLALALPRIWDAFTDPLVGYLSDHTRSRWGRRKPYLLVGGMSVGICMALMWQLPHGWSEMAYFWYFLIASLFFYLSYTVYATPFVAMGYELTPDYHERTRLMGAMNIIGGLAAIPMAWLFAITQWDLFDDGVQGARVLAIFLGLLVIVLSVVVTFFLHDPTKEKFQKRTPASSEGPPALPFFKGIKVTLSRYSFRCLCLATLAFFPGLLLVQNFGSFLVIYYVYGGEKAPASVLLGWSGMLSAILGIVFIPLVTYLGTHLGKSRAFIVCASLALFGTLIKWFCYQPDMPYVNLVPGPFIGIGFAALWVLMGSMIADVCDEDECDTGERREGTYGSIFWWMVKLGMSASLGLAGFLLNLTGFEEDTLGPQTDATIFSMRVLDVAMPAVCIILSILFMLRYPLSEARSYEIRQQLDAQRKSPQPHN